MRVSAPQFGKASLILVADGACTDWGQSLSRRGAEGFVRKKNDQGYRAELVKFRDFYFALTGKDVEAFKEIKTRLEQYSPTRLLETWLKYPDSEDLVKGVSQLSEGLKKAQQELIRMLKKADVWFVTDTRAEYLAKEKDSETRRKILAHVLDLSAPVRSSTILELKKASIQKEFSKS